MAVARGLAGRVCSCAAQRPRLLFVAALLGALLLPSASGAFFEARGAAASRANLVKNPGFEKGTRPWRIPPEFRIARSTARAHSGSASLKATKSSRDLRPQDGNTGYDYFKLPREGRYRAEAWVYLPAGYNGGPPAIYLEFYAGAEIVGRHIGKVRRGRWQHVWAEYRISGSDHTGFLVLRAIVKLPSIGKSLFWDDVRVRRIRG